MHFLLIYQHRFRKEGMIQQQYLIASSLQQSH